MILTDSLKVAVIDGLTDEKIVPASNLYIIRLDKKIIEPVFFKMLLETETANSLFKAFGGGQALPAISIEFLNNLLVPVPSKEIQENFVNQYKAVEKEQTILKKAITALTEKKARILTAKEAK